MLRYSACIDESASSVFLPNVARHMGASIGPRRSSTTFTVGGLGPQGNSDKIQRESSVWNKDAICSAAAWNSDFVVDVNFPPGGKFFVTHVSVVRPQWSLTGHSLGVVAIGCCGIVCRIDQSIVIATPFTSRAFPVPGVIGSPTASHSRCTEL
jgi:hypothetical protein